MSLEETFLQMRRLPENQREQLLEKIGLWLQETLPAQVADIQRAVVAVERTWASIPMRRELVRWVAESKELEYDVR